MAARASASAPKRLRKPLQRATGAAQSYETGDGDPADRNGPGIEAGGGQIGECIGGMGGPARSVNTPGYGPTRPPRRRRSCTTSSRRATALQSSVTGDAWEIDADGSNTWRALSATPSAGRARTFPPTRWPERLLGCPGVKEANVYMVRSAREAPRAAPARLVGPGNGARVRSSRRSATRWLYNRRPLICRCSSRILAGAGDHRHLQDPQDGPDAEGATRRSSGPPTSASAKRGYVKITKSVYEKTSPRWEVARREAARREGASALLLRLVSCDHSLSPAPPSALARSTRRSRPDK